MQNNAEIDLEYYVFMISSKKLRKAVGLHAISRLFLTNYCFLFLHKN